jgi:ferredoxin
MLQITVNQRLCIGNGVCAEIAPEVFVLGDDDLAYLHEDGRILPGDASVIVPERLNGAVLEACDQCPAGCIDIDVVP